jgi:hypothetical protein
MDKERFEVCWVAREVEASVGKINEKKKEKSMRARL